MINKSDGPKNRIIVIGGGGFIGSNLLLSLADTENEVVVVGRSSGKKIDFVGDFGDIDFMQSILRADDIVVHLACSTIPVTSEKFPEKDQLENIQGTINLLAVCNERNIKKFIFLSSGGTVYGDHGARPITEDVKPRPMNRHGAMKLAIENEIKQVSAATGLKYIIVRPSNIYGRTDALNRLQGLIDVIVAKVINNKSVQIWGDGKAVRDYLHVTDLADLLKMVIFSEVSNEIINAGTGKGLSINEVVEKIKSISGVDFKVEYLEQRGFDVQHNILHSDKAKELFGWNQGISLEEGIKKLINNLKN